MLLKGYQNRIARCAMVAGTACWQAMALVSFGDEPHTCATSNLLSEKPFITGRATSHVGADQLRQQQ